MPLDGSKWNAVPIFGFWCLVTISNLKVSATFLQVPSHERLQTSARMFEKKSPKSPPLPPAGGEGHDICSRVLIMDGCHSSLIRCCNKHL